MVRVVPGRDGAYARKRPCTTPPTVLAPMSDSIPLTRRGWLAVVARGAAAASATSLLLGADDARGAVAGPPTPILVHKDASCRCCATWVGHLRANGFRPTVRDEPDMATVKKELGVPVALQSCHTAVVGGYVVEGHVPAADVRRLLATHPKIVGLAVPGMVTGSPGMEIPGQAAERYDVLAFDAAGKTRRFARY